MYELVEKILYAVTFIAVGGTLALVFFFVFAPSILGLKALHKEIEALSRQVEEINERLRGISSGPTGGDDRAQGAG